MLNEKIKAILQARGKDGRLSRDYHIGVLPLRITFWDEEKLGPQPTQEELDTVDAAGFVRNTEIDGQIRSLEIAKLAPRFVREDTLWGHVKEHLRDVMGLPNPRVATEEQKAAAIAALSDRNGQHYNAGFVRLKAFDDQVAALRAQRQ